MPYFHLPFPAIVAQAAPGIFEQLIKSPILPFLVIGVLLYFMMLRPEKMQRERLKNQQASLKKNDRVVIAGGIYGIVVDAPKEGDRVKIRVDENNNTTLRVMRSSILQVLDDEAKEGSKTDADAASTAEK